MRCVIFGHSNIDALIAASWEPDSIVNTQTDVEFKLVRMPITTPAAVPISETEWGANPSVIAELEGAGAFDDLEATFVSIMGGNEYNLVGMVQPSEPFTLEGLGGVGMSIPAGLLKRHVETATKWRTEFLPYIKSRVHGPLVVADTPPPIRDNAFIRTCLARRAGEPEDTFVISQPELRLAL